MWNAPSHHDAESLDLLQIERLSILLGLPAISWSERGPWNVDDLVFGIAGDRLRWKVEVNLPGNRRLLAASVRVTIEKIVLQDESVALL